VEQEARRRGSPLPLAVLSSALTFTNRQLRRRVHSQPSAAWPSAPNFDLQMLSGCRNFLTPASAPSPVLTRLTTSPAVHSSLWNGSGPGGRLLFTDPIALTGPLTNAEVAVRSSAGFYLFVPHGYDESVMAQCGLRLLALTRIIAIILEAISYS
jgi:hypothetical protein